MRIGVDTGGTFTDLVGVDGDRIFVAKIPSTPQSPAEAVLDGVLRILDGRTLHEFVHSTTVATNAILERRGGPTALITTRGFEDVLELGRQARPQLYALHPTRPPPLVPASHRLGLDERLAPDGSVELAVRLGDLVERVRALDARSIAICLLHAYANGAHERAARDALEELGLPISLSSEVLPAPREYERTATTVADAYVRPVIAPYLARLRESLAPARLRVLQSNGGALALDDAAQAPVRTLLSGPAAGVVGARAVLKARGIEDAVTLDMGGTSTDVALLAGGACAERDEGSIGELPLQLPMLSVHTVGAGGGSIARLDEGGALKVGPQSAGALPGPACYGKGGALPTVTDANLILGRLHFLCLPPTERSGGGFPPATKLDLAAARQAMRPLAEAMKVSIEEAARGLVAVADAVMARAIKTISVERGVDPRGLTLVSFGGAGAMHAAAVAAELGITKILVPPAPGLLCAYGALVSDVVHDRLATRLRTVAELTPDDLAAELAPLEREVGQALARDGISDGVIERSASLRYKGQSFDLLVPMESDLVAAFHEAHRARYGYALRDREVELVTLRVRGIGAAVPVAPPRDAVEEGDPEIARHGEIRVLARNRLRGAVEGPALIVEYSATTWLPAGTRAEVLEGGALAMTL